MRNILYFIGVLFSFLSISSNSNVLKQNIPIGHLVGIGNDYKVYTPMFEIENGKVVCASQYRAMSILTQEEKQKINREYIDYLRKNKKPIYDEYNRKLKSLLKPYNERVANISARNRLEWHKKWSKIEKERQEAEQQLYEWQKKEYARIDSEAMARKNKSLKGGEQYFYLYVIHAPADPEQTIVPILGRHVTTDHLRDFNRIVSPFLSTCGELSTVQVIHYYRDQYNSKDNSVPEKNIVLFTYHFHNNKLVVKDSEHPPLMYLFDPEQNSELTLAGFRDRQNQAKRMAAEYRKNFLYAAGRKPGIVYKLDPFWRHFEQFEIARRIFDGDFVQFNKTIEFKVMYMALADVYSKRCSDKVKQYVTYNIPYTEYAGSNWKLDGSQTIYQVEGVKKIRIDSRFAAQWTNYRPVVNTYYIKSMLSGEAANLMRMSPSQAPREIMALARNILVEHIQMDKFIREQGCDSATVQQMVDNFLRAGKGMHSVQRIGIQYQGAEQESNPVKNESIPP